MENSKWLQKKETFYTMVFRNLPERHLPQNDEKTYDSNGLDWHCQPFQGRVKLMINKAYNLDPSSQHKDESQEEKEGSHIKMC